MLLGLASIGENALLGVFEVSSEQIDLRAHFRVEIHMIIGEYALLGLSLFIQIFICLVFHRLRGLICRAIVVVRFVVLWRRHYMFKLSSRLHFGFFLSKRLSFSSSHTLGQAFLFLNTFACS